MMLQILYDIREQNKYLEGYDEFVEGLDLLITYCRLVDIEINIEKEVFDNVITLVINFELVVGVIFIINKKSLRLTYCSLDIKNRKTEDQSLLEVIRELREEVMDINV